MSTIQQKSSTVQDSYLPRRQLLAEKFDIFGLSEVRRWIIRTAEAKSSQTLGVSWNKIITAAGHNGSHDLVTLYLSEIHPNVLRSLILGNITILEASDVNFKHHLRNHILNERPSTYLNVPCRKGVIEECTTQQSMDRRMLARYEGYGPTVRQLENVLKEMYKYCKWSESKYNGLATEIDAQFAWVNTSDSTSRVLGEDHPTKRRYLPTHASVKVVKEWVKRVFTDLVSPAKGKTSIFHCHGVFMKLDLVYMEKLVLITMLSTKTPIIFSVCKLPF
jgi:hypothetical protein